MQVARHTRPEGLFKVCGLQWFFCQRPLPCTPRAKTGLPPFTVHTDGVSSIRSLACRAESTTSPILRSKCHDRYSNSHYTDQTPELESSALNRSVINFHLQWQNSLVQRLCLWKRDAPPPSYKEMILYKIKEIFELGCFPEKGGAYGFIWCKCNKRWRGCCLNTSAE